MKYLLFLSLFIFGCNIDPIEVKVSNDIKVETLFYHDGCTIYRFYDGGKYVYFANCPNVQCTNLPIER